MSETMVERVARAIYDAADPTSGDCVAEALAHSPYVGDGGRPYKDDLMDICRSAARAAIEAMPPEIRALSFEVVSSPYEQGWNHALAKVVAMLEPPASPTPLDAPPSQVSGQ